MQGWLAKLLTGGQGAEIVAKTGEVLQGFVTTREEKLAVETAWARMASDNDRLQAEINKIEAQGNWWQRGWRPFIGWGGGASFWSLFAVFPNVILWSWFFDREGVDLGGTLREVYSAELLFGFLPILGAILGISTQRHFEKRAAAAGGIDRKALRAIVKARKRLAAAGVSDEEAEALIAEMTGG